MSGHVSPDRMSYSVLRAISSSAATAVFERPANAAAKHREISAAQNTAVGAAATLRPSGHEPDLKYALGPPGRVRAPLFGTPRR